MISGLSGLLLNQRNHESSQMCPEKRLKVSGICKGFCRGSSPEDIIIWGYSLILLFLKVSLWIPLINFICFLGKLRWFPKGFYQNKGSPLLSRGNGYLQPVLKHGPRSAPCWQAKCYQVCFPFIWDNTMVFDVFKAHGIRRTETKKRCLPFFPFEGSKAGKVEVGIFFVSPFPDLSFRGRQKLLFAVQATPSFRHSWRFGILLPYFPARKCWGLESAGCDPKTGELYLLKAKSGETLMEAWSVTDVQIVRQMWV